MKTIKIGRGSNNDVVIKDDVVSTYHAILTVSDLGEISIKDLNSTNGTFVDGKKVTEAKLSSSSTVVLGSHSIDWKQMVRGSVSKPVTPKNPIMIPPTVVEKKIIGRGVSSNIRFAFDEVSDQHAFLCKQKDGSILLIDNNSTNGTFVNGQRITTPYILHKGDNVTIAKRHTLNWETIYPKQIINTIKYWKAIVASVVVLLCLGGGIWLWQNNSWDQEKTYKEYGSAVCWVLCEYGYKIIIDGVDMTQAICELYDAKYTGYLRVKDGKVDVGVNGAQGTAFFISTDGKLATNLHITRPWLYSNDAKILKAFADQTLVLLSSINPAYLRSSLEIKGELVSLYIVPNGLPISNNNAIACGEYKGYDDIDKDVAIIQTDTRSLPVSVKRVIDYKEADITPEAILQGKKVFTIGFPYGAELALNSNKELQNQVHGGVITQDKGEYAFGHDAATAGGASGSPIINTQGRLVGIHHAGMTGVTGAQGFNSAIKAKYIIELLK